MSNIELAERFLTLVDASPDRLAIIKIPDDGDIDAIEDKFRRAYDLAKRERPDLAVKLLPPLELAGHRVSTGTALLAVIHEHRWVGGTCVNGCRDTKPAA